MCKQKAELTEMLGSYGVCNFPFLVSFEFYQVSEDTVTNLHGSYIGNSQWKMWKVFHLSLHWCL